MGSIWFYMVQLNSLIRSDYDHLLIIQNKELKCPPHLPFVVPLNFEEHLIHAGQEIVVQHRVQLPLAAGLALLELLGQIDPVLLGLAHATPGLAQLFDGDLRLHDRRIAVLQAQVQTVAEADLADVRRLVVRVVLLVRQFRSFRDHLGAQFELL